MSKQLDTNIIVNSKYVVSKHRLKKTDMFGSLLEWCNTRELQLPLPTQTAVPPVDDSDGSDGSYGGDDVVNDYIKHITTGPKSVEMMKQCLRYADLIGDKLYLSHLVREMLEFWSSRDYKSILVCSPNNGCDNINTNIIRDIYCYLPFSMIPTSCHNNTIGSFYQQWLSNHSKDIGIVVDQKYFYTHHIITDNDGTVNIKCYRNGSILMVTNLIKR